MDKVAVGRMFDQKEREAEALTGVGKPERPEVRYVYYERI